MVIVRNWRQIVPVVSHETAVVYSILNYKGREGKTPEEAPLQGFQALTLHMMQPGMSGDYHVHYDRHQVYVFTEGRGQMNIDDRLRPVRKGDTVCIPIGSHHQMVNDSKEWLAHLIINCKPVSEGEQEKNKVKIAEQGFHNVISQCNWFDSPPRVSDGGALVWSTVESEETKYRACNGMQVVGLDVTLQRLQTSLQTRTCTRSNEERVYYFTEGCGKVTIRDETAGVRDGDAVYGPPGAVHGVVNDGSDWLEYIVVSTRV